MADHPLNLALRLLLELGILAALAVWGWSQGQGLTRPLLASLVPIAAALLWGTFRVPGDGGDPLVTVSGVVRFLLELSLFALAIWALYAADRSKLALVFGALTLLHYALSYERVLELLRSSGVLHPNV